MNLNELDTYEDALLQEFGNIEIFKKLEELKETHFHAILLQRRYISYCFTIVYDFAIDALANSDSKIIARKILREEYPDESGRAPSHREDLFNDLIKIGISKSEIIRTLPTSTTLRNINETIETVINLSVDLNSELKLLTFIRFWGEILVSIEYEQYWRRLERLFRKSSSHSLFYLVHLTHDKKKTSLSDISSLATTHPDRLSLQLIKVLRSSGKSSFEDFRNVEKRVFELKKNFYTQFDF